MIQCFNWDTNTLNIETQSGIKFNLVIRENKTVICGESATGKTLLCNTIKEYKELKGLADGSADSLKKYDTNNIIILDKSNKNELSNLKHKLIIIDRADLILDRKNIRMINYDTDINKYLLISRKPLGIDIIPNNFGEFRNKNGVIEIEYIFDTFGKFF